MVLRIFFSVLIASTQIYGQSTTDKVSPRPIITGDSPNLSARRDLSDRNLALGAPRFVEPGLYNAFDHNGSPMGLLEREKGGVNIGMRYLANAQQTEKGELELGSSNFILPFLGFTVQDVMSSRMYYRKIHDDVTGTNNAELSMHMGGFDLGFGAKSKYFQMGLSGHGSYAHAKDNDDNKKILFGLHTLDFSMGSQVHSMVRIGAHVGLKSPRDIPKKLGAD